MALPYEGLEIDLKVLAEGDSDHRTHKLGELFIATPEGGLVTLSSVAKLREVNGPIQNNHRERE